MAKHPSDDDKTPLINSVSDDFMTKFLLAVGRSDEDGTWVKNALRNVKNADLN